MSASSLVRFVDLKAAHAEVAEEVNEGFARVLSTTGFVKGPEVQAFEAEFAAFSGSSHCVGVGNGTDAIEFALRAAALPAGSEVVLPANTFVATAEAVVRAGLRPVLADADPDYLLLDPALAIKALTADTAAVLPVHLFGQLAPMAALTEACAERDIAVFEDAAQAHGATQQGRGIGAFGAAAAVSFYPGKNLGAYGDAGGVVTNSDELARNVRLLADHGSERKYEHETIGFNSRMDALQGVVLRAKLRRLAAWNERRNQAAVRYQELLGDLAEVTLPQTIPGNEHVWHLYVIQVPRRDQVLKHLQDRGIEVGIHYPVPVHLQPAFRSLGYAQGDFPVAEAAAERMLSLPIHPHITPDQQQLVAKELRSALQS
jgi:dTDP-4-amino-4,6-dideoxygalactose transaminase